MAVCRAWKTSSIMLTAMACNSCLSSAAVSRHPGTIEISIARQSSDSSAPSRAFTIGSSLLLFGALAVVRIGASPVAGGAAATAAGASAASHFRLMLARFGAMCGLVRPSGAV